MPVSLAVIAQRPHPQPALAVHEASAFPESTSRLRGRSPEVGRGGAGRRKHGGREAMEDAPAEDTDPGGDSGHVSQSHSSASGLWDDEAADAPGRDLPLLRRAAEGWTRGLLPGAEAAALDAGLDELLARVDELAGLLDLLRADSAAAVRDALPRVLARAAALRGVFARVERLEAFVRLAAAGVARLERELVRAEAELGASPRGALRRLLRLLPGTAPSAPPSAPPKCSALTTTSPPGAPPAGPSDARAGRNPGRDGVAGQPWTPTPERGDVRGSPVTPVRSLLTRRPE